ncbi:phytanoyl-CoA dioxygenase family protein [Paenibacillus humicola]|uniref:phytanoyl-CoA dioxygenase family protein n=1 Tax=Paenibacillus humicola TaxID=3110540 RepID=UPI00237C2503|nr:phytanoyl-CoA dioxygenase family protein [Paenibacillus humicola]
MMKLTFDQRKQLIENGYVVVPGVVSDLLVRRAVKAINHALGKSAHDAQHETNYVRELGRRAEITDLFNETSASALLDSLVGEGNYNPIVSAQVALRFPDYQDPPNPYAGAHLDGMLKLKDGIVENFTALVGVLLSDQPEPNMGNFIVYPGSHRLYRHYFEEHGPCVLLTEEAFRTMHRSPNVMLPEPVQVTGRAGDLVICHYQLIHGGGPNVSSSIRYSCYYRVYHREVTQDWETPLVEMWKHWPGLKDDLEREGAAN